MQIKIACEGALRLRYNELTPLQGDLKSLSKTNYAKLKKQIEELGFSEPISIWQKGSTNYILNGHQRLRVIKQMVEEEGYNIDHIPVNIVEAKNKTEAKKKVLALTSQFGKIEDEGLLEFIQDMDIELPDLADNYSFADLDLDTFIDSHTDKTEGSSEGEDDVPDVKETSVKLGDIWLLGEHRLMCGDSTKKESVALLMADEKADLVLTDPPYNAGISAIANDSFSSVEGFLDFTNTWFKLCLDFTKENASYYVWGFEKTICEIKVSFNKYDLELANMIIWDKVCFGRTLPKFKSNKEICLFYKRGKPVFHNQKMKSRSSVAERFGKSADEAGNYQYGNYTGNIFEGPCTDVWWDIPNMGRGGNTEFLNKHPTQKPLKACNRIISASSDPSDLILDLFLGTGSTLIAAEESSRRCYGMELSPEYCQIIIDRWQEYSGKKAVKEK
jgi:DNA modification methylase